VTRRLEIIYNKTVKYSYYQKDNKMDFVTFIAMSNLIRLFTNDDYFNFGSLSIDDKNMARQDLNFYSLVIENKYLFLKNFIYYLNIAKGMKTDDAIFLINYKHNSISFTPNDVKNTKIDIEHFFLMFRLFRFKLELEA